MKKTIKLIKEILVDEVLLAIPEDQIQEEDNLVKDLGLDSIQIMELIVASEKKFGIRFEDEELNYKVFKSIGSLGHKIEEKKAK